MQLRLPRARQSARLPRRVAARASRDPSRRAAAPMTGGFTGDSAPGTEPHQERPIPTSPYETPDGKTIAVLKDDYGFRTGASRLYDEHYGEVPANIFSLAIQNFREEWKAMRKMFVKDVQPQAAQERATTAPRKAAAWLGDKLAEGLRAADGALVNAHALESVDNLEFDDVMTPMEVRARLQRLELDAKRVRDIEIARFKDDPPNAPWYIKVPYFALCWVLDLVYEGRPIQRFWVLEEVARMPYFAYISMLHLYESLGWWRAGAALRKVHFAEEWNELHHLQIMESLGGDNAWIDRFVAQHAAIAYFWGVMLLYALSPRNAYQFSELVEGHATDTYEVFAEQNRELLESIPPPRVAVEYYCGKDQTMYQSFLVSAESQCRQPTCETMLDMFHNIIDDEVEHKKTMAACQDPAEVARQLVAAQDVSCDIDGKPVK